MRLMSKDFTLNRGIAMDRLEMEETIKVKHGFWDFVHHYQDKADGTCSICRKHGKLRVSRDDWGIWYIDSPYCPACGSIMDGKINYA